MGFCMCWLVPGWGWILLSLAYSHSNSHSHSAKTQTKLLSNDSRLGESVREALLTHAHGTETHHNASSQCSDKCLPPPVNGSPIQLGRSPSSASNAVPCHLKVRGRWVSSRRFFSSFSIS
ncbi:hypothetical protein HDV62DRAFT_109349 [Trichoderma sp. SZMC 28011]